MRMLRDSSLSNAHSQTVVLNAFGFLSINCVFLKEYFDILEHSAYFFA